MSEIVLNISDLTKSFGNILAVNRLSLQVKRGQVFGILGPNGSGKTTTLAMLLGIVHPTSGDFSWFEKGKGPEQRRRIGTLLETPNFYPGLSARRNLEIAAAVKQISNPDIDGVLKTVNLLERAESPFRTFSLGMKQRLAIGSVLLGNPEVMVLDEPTNGLDPQGIAEIRELIRNVAQRNITVILASHLLDEVQRVCTEICIIRKGQLMYTGSLSVGQQDFYHVHLGSRDLRKLESVCAQLSCVQKIQQEGDVLRLQVNSDISVEAFHQSLIDKGIVLTSLRSTIVDLESKFLELIK